VAGGARAADGASREAAQLVAFAADPLVVGGHARLSDPDVLRHRPGWRRAPEAESAAQCDLLRDCFGSPVRSLMSLEPAVLTNNRGAARHLAESIYAARRFEDLPVLADLLEEAGCTDAGLLGHLRGPGPHILGCHALDTVRGKS
jgi:hypothetical protein